MQPAAFDWIRRMGVHEAYHRDPTNRLLHWLCIPLELAVLLKLLALVPAPLDLGLVAVVLVGIVYVAADIGAGVAMTALLLALRALASRLTTESALADATLAAVSSLPRSPSRPASATACWKPASTTPR